jgi:hypothetical protein
MTPSPDMIPVCNGLAAFLLLLALCSLMRPR